MVSALRLEIVTVLRCLSALRTALTGDQTVVLRKATEAAANGPKNEAPSHPAHEESAVTLRLGSSRGRLGDELAVVHENAACLEAEPCLPRRRNPAQCALRIVHIALVGIWSS